MVFPIADTGLGEVYYGTSRIDEFLPKEETLGKEFRNRYNKWVQFANYWFENKGLDKDVKIYPKKGIDKEAAIKHIQALVHTHPLLISKDYKLQGIAFLMSQWFENVDYPA